MFGILTASFKQILIIYYLIIIHELGHALIGNILGIKLVSINIYPIGGITKFDMDINTKLSKEFIMLISGPIFQIIACSLLIFIFPNLKETILFYNNNILIFNLLPILPLDGGKILNIILCNFVPFKKSLIISAFISLITILVLIISLKQNYINIVVMEIFLLILIFKEKNKINYIYSKFLLERYMKKYSFKKIKIIKRINDMYKNRYHFFKISSGFYSEKEYLQKKYKKI